MPYRYIGMEFAGTAAMTLGGGVSLSKKYFIGTK